MNAFLNPHSNGPSLTGVIDITAHSISLFQENGEPQDIKDTHLKVIVVLLNLMIFRPAKQEITLLLCTSLLAKPIIQKLVV